MLRLSRAVLGHHAGNLLMRRGRQQTARIMLEVHRMRNPHALAPAKTAFRQRVVKDKRRRSADKFAAEQTRQAKEL